MISSIERIILCALGALTVSFAIAPQPAMAHGERATEPYIRTRTIQWYDVKWSTGKMGVNDMWGVS